MLLSNGDIDVDYRTPTPINPQAFKAMGIPPVYQIDEDPTGTILQESLHSGGLRWPY